MINAMLGLFFAVMAIISELSGEKTLTVICYIAIVVIAFDSICIGVDAIRGIYRSKKKRKAKQCQKHSKK